MRRLKKRYLLLGLATLAILAEVSSTRGVGSTSAPSAVESLSGSSALEHIRFLSSDELGGRGNGTDGLAQARDYIASQFSKFGLAPAGEDGTYFQPFPVTIGGDLGEDNTL